MNATSTTEHTGASSKGILQATTHSSSPVQASVVDLFCGAGGLTHGFKLEGFPIVCGIDVDESCRYAFETNNDAPFVRWDVSEIRGTDIDREFHRDVPRVLVGCAPCQPFSTYNAKNSDPKWRLLREFLRLIIETRPHVVSMENVPALTKFRNGSVFREFVDSLEAEGYHVWWNHVFCPEYGVPQRRTRLVLLASKLGEIELEEPIYTPDRYPTVESAIAGLPELKAGEAAEEDPLHKACNLSPINLMRIKASRPGGSWRDWPPELIAECHKRDSGNTYPSVYGRMSWNEPSPTITTQFHGFGNGRFGHPEQDRAISLREGAILQSFPRSYAFVRPGDPIEFSKIGRLIGNAVPVELARAIARSIRRHLERHQGGQASPSWM